MKTKKTITAICASLMALASASISMAETKEDYIKTFGMIMFERNGLLELEFTPEEFDAFVAGMKAVNESRLRAQRLLNSSAPAPMPTPQRPRKRRPPRPPNSGKNSKRKRASKSRPRGLPLKSSRKATPSAPPKTRTSL